MTTRTRLPFRLLSPEAALPVASVPGSPVEGVPVEGVPVSVLEGVPPQPASRPTAMEAERSRAVNFLNFIVQFLPFVRFIHWGCSVLACGGWGRFTTVAL